MANTIRLTWGAVDGAVEYRIYHSTVPGISIARSVFIATVTELTYDHINLIPNSTHYYRIVAVGPNNELSPPSNEIGLTAGILVSITITPATFNIIIGNTQQYTAIGHYADSSTSDITSLVIWDTDNHAIASISPSGMLTAIANGSTNVTATLNLIDGNTGVIVGPIVLQSISITPTNFSLNLGQQQQFTATGHYNDNSTADVTNLVTWSVSDDAYAIATDTDLIPVPNAINNGSFETGNLTGWNITSGTLALPQFTANDPLSLGGDITDPTPYLQHVLAVPDGYIFSPYSSTADAYSGTYSLMIGSSANASEDYGYNEVTQTFIVPSVGQPVLSFQAKFYNPAGDTTLYDMQQAILVDAYTNDTLIDLFSSIDSYPLIPFIAEDNNAAWINFTQDLTLYAGRTLKLVFRNRGDGSSDPVWFLIDDVQTIANSTAKGVITANSIRGGTIDVIATLGLISGNTSLTISPILTQLNLELLYTSSFGRQYQAIGTYSDSSTRMLNEFVVWNSTNTGVATVNDTGFVTLNYVPGSAIISATLDGYSTTTTITMVTAWGNEALYTNPPSVPVFENSYAISSPAAYAVYSNGNNIIKSNGLGTWSTSSLSLGSPPSTTNCVWASGSTVILGATGTTTNAIIRSTNSGSTWATVSNSTTSDIRSMHGSSASDIWAGGELNKLIHSVDGGASWSSVSFPGGFINAIYARTSTDVWLGGANSIGTGGVFYNYNGTTFTSFYPAISTVMLITSIWSSSATDIYVAGMSVDGQIQYIHHSTNGGSTFTLERKLFVPSFTTKASLLGIDANNVYFAASPTQLLYTTGNGIWTRENVSINTIHTSDHTAGIKTLMGFDNTNIWMAGAGFAGGSINHSFIFKKNIETIIEPILLQIVVSAGPTTFINGGPITNSDTSIFVATYTTNNFPSSGTIKIDNEEITYTSKTIFGFFGCTRGANSTVAASHNDQSLIINLQYQTLSGSGQYNAIGYYDDGRIIELTGDVSWDSSNTAAATISNNSATPGAAFRIAAGSSIISATLGDIVGTLTITVT